MGLNRLLIAFKVVKLGWLRLVLISHSDKLHIKSRLAAFNDTGHKENTDLKDC